MKGNARIMGRIISMASGKGGVGKSTVSVMLAYNLAKLSKKVLVIDMDKGLRSLDLMLNVTKKTIFDLSDILSGNCKKADAIYKSDYNENLSVITASLDTDFDLDPEKFFELLKELRESYDFVILDAPAGLGKGFFISTCLSETAFLVTTPDPLCVRDVRLAADEIEREISIPLRLIINRVKSEPFFYKGIKSFDDIIDMSGVQLFGIVYEDSVMVNGLLNGEIEEDSDSFYALNRIARRLCGEKVPLKMKY